jgi:LysM repeat protein
MHRLTSLGVTLVLMLALATPAFGQEPAVHVVQRGENLFRIALRYGVTVDVLAATNNLSNPRLIRVGQRLVIPQGTRPTPSRTSRVHIVQAGENLYRIARRYGVTTKALAVTNGIVNTSRIYVGQRLVIPGQTGSPLPPATSTPSSHTYTVRRGDTLSAIALRYGVSIWALVQANGVRNPSLIYPGQVLRIPRGASPAPSSPPATTGHPSGRWIDIDLSAQRLTAYQGNKPVRSTLVSTGLSRTPTPRGQYRIYVKYASASMSGPGYHVPNVPYVMYFYRSYSIHGTYWHNNFGRRMSHGCVNLPTSEARWLYKWASVGTLVKIHQ